MADIDFIGLEDLIKNLSAVATCPSSVQDAILNAEADVAIPAQRRTASTMLIGPYNRGAVAAAITKTKPVIAPDGRKLYLTFNGTQHGTRLAEIAFINEYGKTGQPARPFIKTALESAEREIEEAGFKVYDEYLKKNNL